MKIDLAEIAQRMTSAATGSSGYQVTASSTDLIISKDGFGTGRSEAIPFAAIFLSQEDVLGQALGRLETGSPNAPVSG